MIFTGIFKIVIPGIWLVCMNGLMAQKDVLLPYMRTNEFYVGETLAVNDKRFKPVDEQMGWYKPEHMPVYFMGLQVDDALLTIEKGTIVDILLFLAPQKESSYAETVLDEKLGKLNIKKEVELTDISWKTHEYEIILRHGISKDMIYLQPLSEPLEDKIPPGTKN